jgi:hypothetical protein
MILPANDKVIALPCVAGEAMEQGTVLRFADLNDGTGRLQAFIATAAGDVSSFGTHMAYWVSPDSQDVEFIGAPESTTFTLNTSTGIGGGVHNIASGAELVALGASAVSLVRLDKNSIYNTPAALTSYPPSTELKLHTSGLVALDSEDDIDVVTCRVVQNDGNTIVVQLRG